MSSGPTLLGKVLRRRWTLERVLGTGGTATVYAATHRNGSRVAIKVLDPSLHADPLTRSRFLREGYIANRIGVPDVVKVLDDDIDGDVAFLVMELLAGASVEALRERAGGRLAAADVAEIGCRLLAVLEAAHACGVLHRDIKPGNLFRTIDPVGFKVLDFGIAKIQGLRAGLADTAVGEDGFMGTPLFTPPEQARGEVLDDRSDLWAAGATLFTLLSGQYVHRGRSTTEVLQAAKERAAPPVRNEVPGAPEELTRVIDRALAFDRTLRFQSASEMRLACEDCRRALSARGERSRFFGAQAQQGHPATQSFRPPADDRASTPPLAETPRTTGVRMAKAEPRAGFWSGRVGRLWWFYYVGPCTEETWRHYLELVQEMVDAGRESTLAFFAHHAEPPGPLQRKQVAEFIEKNSKALERLDRFALVVDSLVHVGVLTAINWLARKPFQERTFNSPLAAIKWLTESHAKLDPETVRASIAAQVPRHSLWPSLGAEAPETISKSALR